MKNSNKNMTVWQEVIAGAALALSLAMILAPALAPTFAAL